VSFATLNSFETQRYTELTGECEAFVH